MRSYSDHFRVYLQNLDTGRRHHTYVSVPKKRVPLSAHAAVARIKAKLAARNAGLMNVAVMGVVHIGTQGRTIRHGWRWVDQHGSRGRFVG